MRGSGSRSRPSRWSRSNRYVDNGVVARSAAASPREAVRAAVTWKGCGRSSGRSATTSPSTTSRSARSPRTCSTTSGNRSVMSSRVRVTTSTSAPSLCAWIRMPSSLMWATTQPPYGASWSRPASTSAALAASMGSTGRPTCSVAARSPLDPAFTATRAAAGVEPRSMAARRSRDAGMPRAAARASSTRASSAPWRTSPRSSRRSRSCSSAVARPSSRTSASRRACWLPLPPTAATAANPASTSSRVTVAVSAGGGGSASERHPMPVRRCRTCPER